ncbi:Sec-independent protein secretion pathway component TatC [Halanaeroarchaeum sp. HSR-CO]|uniref:twin-arginine translocase subunit TatC n=1 Tax=Halanaeroarchaeum sp. HSR-CO TaxID=2866382 RepID=UPI00217EA8BE|nr:twin-arginine translocase subunit TatC [Halanaeroarchaeum sp. HSR-CO]UWG48985.1 Sec-independent protein secretion pathway component TatC [Halanaeroarchaeum sp. HSR-CO]
MGPDDVPPREDADESGDADAGRSGEREADEESAPSADSDPGPDDDFEWTDAADGDPDAATTAGDGDPDVDESDEAGDENADADQQSTSEESVDEDEGSEDGESDAEDGEDGESDAEDGEDGESDAEDGEDGESDAEDGEDEADDAPEPIDDGVPDWDVGRNTDEEDDDTGDGAEDTAGFEIPSDVDIREGYDEYEDRVDFDGDSTERTTEVDLADEDVATVSDPDSTAFERKAASGPQSDEEQPLAVHIEEMIKRLGIVIAIAGAVSLAAFPFAEDVVTFLWYSILPADVSQPHVYHPLELVLTQLKTASLAGLVIALPAFVYETYAFMRPGLYPHERRYYLAAVPTSLVLALVGVSFAYFIVLPAVMNYFLYYSETVVDIAFALGATFNLFLILMGYLALVFQIPLFIMLAIMMGLTTREWMEERRIIFWGVFLGLSFLFSPDPTGMAPLIVAATMVALFEGTLLVLRWTNRG